MKIYNLKGGPIFGGLTVMTDSGWIYVVIVLDWYTKKIVGHYSGKQARSAEWLQAL